VSTTDNRTLGLTDKTHALLQSLKQDGVFNEMADGYRFAIALAIAHGQIAPKQRESRTTVLNVGSLDPDGSIRSIIIELYPDEKTTPYAIAERLAEWGMAELARLHESGPLRFSEIFKSVQDMS
jgi:hypothetical protein